MGDVAAPKGDGPEDRDLDTLIDWFERFSSGLVLLEPHPLDEVRQAIATFDAGVRDHVTAASRPDPGPLSMDPRLESEHRRFLGSLEQLWWFYRIVEGDDHGGHRQALGQYGRLVTEALRRHRADERGGEAPGAGPAGRTRPDGPLGNDK